MQTALLDQFIKSGPPQDSPEVMEIIINILRTNPDLRNYFFINRPVSSWVPVLWNHGFFKSQPGSEFTESGPFIAYWDVHEYLLSVAQDVPDYFVSHLNNLDISSDWHKAHAIECMLKLDPELVVTLVPKVIKWLSKGSLNNFINHNACQLLLFLSKHGYKDKALSIFAILTKPVIRSDDKKENLFVNDYIKLSTQTPISLRGHSDIFKTILEELDTGLLINILEENLRFTLLNEAKITGTDPYKNSYWRSAIEDTEQDLGEEAKDLLIRALRDAIETLIIKSPISAYKIVEDYLKSESQIFRRLGLHFLNQHPSHFISLVEIELLNYGNLDDTAIHHEFFLLLRNGFEYLTKDRQETLVNEILHGPPSETIKWLVQSVTEEYGSEKDDYREKYVDHWICNRLWMIKEFISGEPKERLIKYIEKRGEPDHPTFLAWMSPVTWIRDVSPYNEEQIISLSSAELHEVVVTWKAKPREEFLSERVSWSGFADQVAQIMITSPEKYISHIESIATFRPEFAESIFTRLSDKKIPINEDDWFIWIKLAERIILGSSLLNLREIRQDNKWREPRRAIVKFIKKGLVDDDSNLPEDTLPQIRDILIALLDDPDPNSEQDRPLEGWFGYMDPFTLAINHIRPMAFEALIHYSVMKAKKDQKTNTDQPRWEPIVRDAITRKLDKSVDPSWSVHSVFGKFLFTLYWLDKEWVTVNISRIFPDGENEDIIWFFVAAWDAYVIFNDFQPDLLPLLMLKYNRAIENYSKGYQTKSHLNLTLRFAVHIALEYILGNYDLQAEAGSQSLIEKFFIETDPITRAKIARASWLILKDNPSDVGKFWPKARKLWEWRAKEATIHGNTSDYDKEMQELAHLPQYAPEYETIQSLWPLLENLIPHMVGEDLDSFDWRGLEQYLLKEVLRNPFRTIQLYKMLFDRIERPIGWLFHSDEAKQIIRLAISSGDPDAKQTALELLDMFLRWGDNTFRDLYFENLR